MEEKCVLVCVTGQKSCERLIVIGAQQAARLGAALTVLHVARTGAAMMGSLSEAEALEYLFQKASDHGGDMTFVRADDVLDALEKQARRLKACLIVTGRAADYRGHDLLDDLQARLPEIRFKIVSTSEKEGEL